jgi:hypothetical protein
MSHTRQSKTCAASHPAHFGASGRPDVDRPPHSQAVPTDRAQLECGQEFKSLFVKKPLIRYVACRSVVAATGYVSGTAASGDSTRNVKLSCRYNSTEVLV